MDFIEDIRIDPNALDVEWLKQPQLYSNYATLLAAAKLKEMKAENNLELARAAVDTKVRKDPERYLNNAKPTEGSIRSYIIQTDEYIDAMDRLLEAKHDANIYSAGVKALDHKKKALANLVILLSMEYFASPKEPRDLGLEFEKDAKQNKADERVRGRLGKSRRTKGTR